ASGGLPLQQLVAIVEENRFRTFELLVEIDDVIEPSAIRMRLCEFINEVFVVKEFALKRIDRHHLACADAAAPDDLAVIERAHAGFRADGKQAIFGARVTKRT